MELLEHFEILKILQIFCRTFGTFGTFGTFLIFAELLKNFTTFEDVLQNFAELLELWESQGFKLNKSWLSIDQCVGKCIKSVKLDKIRGTDEKKRTFRAFAYAS